MENYFTKQEVQFRQRRQNLERLFIFKDINFIAMVSISKNSYHNQEYYFLNNIKSIAK